MKPLIFVSILTLSLLPSALIAQERATVSGTITDRSKGYALPSATVSIAPVSDTGAKTYTSSDLKGTFSFNAIATGEYIISITYVGYKPT